MIVISYLAPSLTDCNSEVPEAIKRCVGDSLGAAIPNVNSRTSTGRSGDVLRQFQVAQAVSYDDAQRRLDVGMLSKPVENKTCPGLSAGTPLRLQVRAHLKRI
jgi:hypothetical protein